MRDIVIVRGPQGSGKSSLIRDCGLEGHHLSFDAMRLVISGDTMSPNGNFGISQQHNQLVVKLTFESLERRMKEGELIAFEATLPRTRDMQKVTDMAIEYGYRIIVADLFGMDVDTVVAAEAARPERVRVNEFAVRRCYDDAKGSQIDPAATVLRICNETDRRHAIDTIQSTLRERTRMVDLSRFERIVHIGDLQGTFDPLMDAASPLAGGLRDDTAYMFCGDLFDRGVQNAEVARFWINHCHDRVGHNVWLIAGNHEDHVERQARGLEPASREWRDRTWPQLQNDGLGHEHMAMIADDLVPLLHYEWRGTKVLVSHGGFPRMPTDLHLLPETILRRGAGEYGRNVDARWNEAQEALPEADRQFQVHGHRNSQMAPTIERWSINLEEQVEFGGHLRFATLDERGWTATQIRPKAYRTMVEAHVIDRNAGRKGHGDEAPITPWAERGDDGLAALSERTLAAFDNHRMVMVNQQESMGHVSSIGFTKSAFYSKTWDDYTTIARGLFIDNVDNTIVARSYEKFFNHGERAETSDEVLERSAVFPVDGFDKLNGFLCITGYSERTGELIVASKSRVDGTFAEYAQALVRTKLGKGGMERLLRFNRDQKASLVFEAVDMANDPHLIDYPEDRLVLIGCVRRSETFEQVDYDTLIAIAKWLGCEVKERLFPQIKDWRALSAIMTRVETDPKWRRDNPTEGIVFQDSAGTLPGRSDLQWKSKAHHYRNLKHCRSGIERIALCRRKEVDFDRARYENMPAEYLAFLDWAQTLPTEALGIGVITLHKMFLHDRSAAEGMGEKPQPKSKDMGGYIRALEGMAARVAAGNAKPESVIKMLEAAEIDEDKRTVLETHPAAAALRAFVASYHDA